MKYRNWVITLYPESLKDLRLVYDVVHENYDGSPASGDDRSFRAESIEDAKREIDEYYAYLDEMLNVDPTEIPLIQKIAKEAKSS
jgi:hypothetical protein